MCTIVKDMHISKSCILALSTSEHGEVYTEGIKPQFSDKKLRTYNAYWNWVRQDVLRILYEAAKLTATHDPAEVCGPGKRRWMGGGGGEGDVCCVTINHYSDVTKLLSVIIGH